MSTRTRRWFVIVVAIAIPAVVVFTATRSFEAPENLDTRFPPACSAIYRQATNGDSSGAAKAATTLVTAAGSSIEEQICAQAALKGLTKLGVSATPPALDLSKDDRCKVVEKFAARGATSAARAAYELLRGAGSTAEKACGTAGVKQLERVLVVASPRCIAVARLYILGPAKAATDAMTKALDDAATTVIDAICLANVAAAAQEFAAVDPVVPSEAQLQPELAPLCTDAATDARKGKIAAARSSYEQQLGDAHNEMDQACAVGGLARLSAEDTFADWSFTQANRVAKRLTGWIPGGPLLFAEGSKNVVVAIFWFLLLGLLIVALRQYVRWRRERLPGPVVIHPVQVSAASDGSKADAVDVAEEIRHNLARAGVFEHSYTGGVSDLFVDVSAALGVSGETGLLGRFFDAVKNAVTIKAGFEMTIHQDRDPDDPDGPHQLVIELNEAATSNTWKVREYSADTPRKAAQKAAFGTYLDLFARDEVRRRTPSFLSWTSTAGLIEYHEANDHASDGKFRTAVKHLRVAAECEPANLQVQLLLTHCQQQLAEGTRRDKALRHEDSVGADYLESLRAALSAVLLNRCSAEAHGRVALVLGYVARWQGAWAVHPSKADLEKLLNQLGDLPGAQILAAPDGEDFKRHFLARAQKHWRTSERCTWWPVVLWVALRLDRRRTVKGEIWPFRRGRKSTHDLLLAADVKTRYDRVQANAANSHHERALTWLHLVRVRFGRLYWLRRIPAQEGNVQYNLAAAYAGRALYKNGGAILPLTPDAREIMHQAMKALRRSYEGTGRRHRQHDVETLESDPDLDALRTTDAYKRWVARFDATGELATANEAWHSFFATLADRADAASRCWHDHLEQPIPTSWRWNREYATWASAAVTKIGDDLARWNALSAWLKNPAGNSVREAFTKSIADPKINAARPFRTLASPTLPGDDAKDADTVRSRNLDMVKLLEAIVGRVNSVVEHDLELILSYVRVRDARAFRAYVHELACEYAKVWADLSNWAMNPDVGASNLVVWLDSN